MRLNYWLVLLFFEIAHCSLLITAQQLARPESKMSETLAKNGKVPFPKWLNEFTGMKEWPQLNPPYIPLDFISFDNVPDIPLHVQGDCKKLTADSCSFDCFNCVSFDDVYTCPKLSQTFDDGPTPATPQLLDGLKQPSTFFTLGVNVISYPEIYRRTMSQGHVMGSHTWSHKFLPSLSNEEIVAQLQWSIWAMNATGHHLPKWFRPPYGGTDDRVRAIVRQFGMQNVLWDFDTLDWKMLDTTNPRKESEVYSELTKFKLSRGGKGLLLEHDVTPRTVAMAIHISNQLLGSQHTVPQCVGGIEYIKKFA